MYFFKYFITLRAALIFCGSMLQLIASMYIQKAINNGVEAFSLLGGKVQVKGLK